MKDNKQNGQEDFVDKDEQLHEVTHLSGMYENWFLDYASYVILER
jgi:topoisomerase-4 subunit A